MNGRRWFIVVASAVMLSLVACEDSGIVRDWDGADVVPTCGPEDIRITGEIDTSPIDISVESGYMFGNFPLWSLEVFDSTIRIALIPDNGSLPVDGWATGVFTLDASDPLYCATRGTYVSYVGADESQAELRSLTRLGVCPGTEAVAGQIQGCVGDPDEGCTVSGEMLPGGGGVVSAHDLAVDGPVIGLQVELDDEAIFHLHTDRAGATLLSEGVVYCVGDVQLDTSDPDRSTFTLGDLTLLGDCREGEPVGGYVNVCAQY
jgi:hypothetical protein